MKVLNLSQLSLIMSQGLHSSEGLRSLLKVTQKLEMGSRLRKALAPLRSASLPGPSLSFPKGSARVSAHFSSPNCWGHPQACLMHRLSSPSHQ